MKSQKLKMKRLRAAKAIKRLHPVPEMVVCPLPLTSTEYSPERFSYATLHIKMETPNIVNEKSIVNPQSLTAAENLPISHETLHITMTKPDFMNGRKIVDPKCLTSVEFPSIPHETLNTRMESTHIINGRRIVDASSTSVENISHETFNIKTETPDNIIVRSIVDPLSHTSQENPHISHQILNIKTESPNLINGGGIVDAQSLTSTGYSHETFLPETLNIKMETPDIVNGRRIIDIAYFFNRLKDASNHNSNVYKCKLANLEIMKEERNGFVSEFFFQCNMCSKIIVIASEKPSNEEVNSRSVLSALENFYQ